MLRIFRYILILIYLIHFLSTATFATSLVTQNAEVSGEVTTYKSVQISNRKVWVTYNHSSFKQISVQNDTTELQVIAPSNQRLALDCHHNWEIEPLDYVKFEYIGVNKNYAKAGSNDVGNITVIYSFNLQNRSPVVRIVCKSHKDDIKKSTLIYGGDGIGPFLYKSDSLKPYMLNRTHIALPCILNYPLRNHSHSKLELYKDKNLLQIENSDSIQYIPELGYVTDVDKLGAFGEYVCKVTNSTEDDQVTLDYNQSSLIYLSSDREFLTVHERQKQTFKCSLPRSKFQDGIEWFYKFENGSFSQIILNFKPDPNITEKYYEEIASVSLVSADIKHVVCAANGTRDGADISSPPSLFNTSFPVYVSRVVKPNIPDIVYNATAKTLRCNVSGTDIEIWRWRKDGKNLTEPDPHIEKHHSRSTIKLDQVPKPHNGTYTCIASNFRGESSANYTLPADSKIGEWSYIIVATSITFAIFLALGISVIVVYKISFERRKLFLPRFWQKRLNPDQGPWELRMLNEFYDENREINLIDILPSDRVRSGNFGQVTLTQLRLPDGSLIPIAVKCIQDASIFRMRTRQIAEQELFDILAEIELMQKLDQHPNIVGYIGAITTGLRNYSASIILEYCCGGDLHTFVGRHRVNIRDDIHELHVGNRPVLKCSHLLKWAEEIAAGVEYLHSRDIIHRDIAARNVLLWHQNNTFNEEDVIPSYDLVAKIADFGMSRDLSSSSSLYYQIVEGSEDDPERQRLRRQIPCRWIACETLRTLKFTKQSDVWALGVTFWEMFALSETPYIDTFPNNYNLRENLYQFLFDGTNSLEMPEFVHPTVWENMILPCWNRFPGSRPSAGGLREGLHQINLDVMAMFRARAEQEDGLIAQDENHVDNGINQQLPLEPLPGYVQIQQVQDE